MLRALLARIRSVLTADGSEPDDREAEDEAGFTPSQLDASVLFAHGKSDETERAIADVEERARLLEQQRRER